MADAIFKGGRRRGFTTVYREVAQDRRLSLKARGLFLLLQSLPETWQYTISGLATLAGTGKDQIRSGNKIYRCRENRYRENRQRKTRR